MLGLERETATRAGSGRVAARPRPGAIRYTSTLTQPAAPPELSQGAAGTLGSVRCTWFDTCSGRDATFHKRIQGISRAVPAERLRLNHSARARFRKVESIKGIPGSEVF